MSKAILLGGLAALLLAPAAHAAEVELVAGPPETLNLVEHATSDATAAIGKAKDNRGDILTFANPVFDAADKKQVGTDNGFCIRTVAGAAYECLWTVKLATGQITVEGPFLDAGESKLAVTGGTGGYVGAKGEMRLRARDMKGSEYDFQYTIIR